MIITGFLLAVGLVMLIVLTNSLLFTMNLPATQDISEKKYTVNIDYLIRSSASRAVTDAYVYIAARNATTQTALNLSRQEFLSFVDSLEKVYGRDLKALDINVTYLQTSIKYVYNDTQGNLNTRGNIVRIESKTFPAGTIIIPMDETQYWLREFPAGDSNRSNFIRTFGLLYRILNDRNESSSPLDDDGMDLIAYRLIQDPRASAVDFTGYDSIKHEILIIGSVLYDPNSTYKTSNVNRIWSLKGGIIAITPDQLNRTHPVLGTEARDLIIQEARSLNVTLLITNQSFSYDYTVMLYKAPRLGIYPSEGANPDIIQGYFTHAGLNSSEYTLLNTTQVENGDLSNIDILFIPHENLGNYMTVQAEQAVMNWVSTGGILHVECEAIGKYTKNIDGMDDLIENVDTTHPWYGFIGVRYDTNKYGKSLNATVENWPFVTNSSYKFTAMSLIQTYTDTLPPRGGSVSSFILGGGGLAYNPDSVILLNSSNDLAQVYVFAPYDSGSVVYLGGHDQSIAEGNIPMPQREMLVFDTFFTSSIVKLIPVVRLNATLQITFSDGDLSYTKNLINISAVSNPLLSTTISYQTSSSSNSSFPSPQFIDPTGGNTISGTYKVVVNASGTQVTLGVDGSVVGNMSYNATTGYWEYYLNTSAWLDGAHLLRAIATDGTNYAWTQISVTFQNGVAGNNAGFEAELRVVEGANYEFQLNNLRFADTGQLIGGASVTFKLYAQSVNEANLLFTGTDITDSNGFASTTYSGSLDPDGTYFLVADVSYNSTLQSFVLQFSPSSGNQTANFVIEKIEIKDTKDKDHNGWVDEFKVKLKGLAWENGTKIEGASVTFRVYRDGGTLVSTSLSDTTDRHGNADVKFKYPDSLTQQIEEDITYYVEATVVYNGYTKVFTKYFSV